jgi:hypothetical protein
MSPGAMSVSTPAPRDITQRRLGHCAVQTTMRSAVEAESGTGAHMRFLLRGVGGGEGGGGRGWWWWVLPCHAMMGLDGHGSLI